MRQVTAAIIERDGKILICQRAEDDECGLLWEFPGGKLEENESLEQCIIREIKEELALDIAVTGVFMTSVYRYAGMEILFTVFHANIVGGNIQLNVHQDAKWVTKEELDLFIFMPADVEFVEAIKKMGK